jgi:hypothetical protein
VQPKHVAVIALYVFIYSFLGAFAKLRKAAINFMSVRQHGTTRLPLDGFL